MWIQRELTLDPRPRGFHLITGEIEQAVPEIVGISVGIATIFIKHTSASLTLNENASPDVRRDFESWANEVIPESAAYWSHVTEGSDDMPAHIKASLFGPTLTVPIADGRLALGTWQGIYLCEHRDSPGPRTLLVTAFGDAA